MIGFGKNKIKIKRRRRRRSEVKDLDALVLEEQRRVPKITVGALLGSYHGTKHHRFLPAAVMPWVSVSSHGEQQSVGLDLCQQ
jgi:hypothetical protein